MADLPALLLASLNPDTRKQAEKNLKDLSRQQGFLSHLLRLVLEPSQDRAVRLSGSVYLKNVTKLRWAEEVEPLAEQDKASLRSELVPAMLALSNAADKSVRAQIAESVSLIAELDFPHHWPTLIDQLVASLSLTNYSVNIGVLQTAHSIFRHWRASVRSDKLYTEINLVLNSFMTPFLQLFRQTSEQLISPPTLPENYIQMAQSMVLLVDIYYDFTCQDLPPAIEDTYDEFFAPEEGWFHRFLSWNPELLRGDAEDTTPSLLAQIKTGILEIAELFIKLYPEQLQKSPAVQAFVQGVWVLVGSNNLPNIGDDGLVSQSLRFISTAIRSGYYKDIFGSKDTISNLVQGVVVPNVGLREHDLEQFEDDPLEFIRLDLALSSVGTDLATRRQAAADVLQALVGSGYEAEATEIVGAWITTGLAEYSANPAENWRAKDSAVYLLGAVATRATTSQHGVTSTNAMVDVVKFFSEHVFQDLQVDQRSVHSILQVDAIRFLFTFRNQLTKEQLLSVLPLLAQRLTSDNYVTYTYAAITIDRILSIKKTNQVLFNQADIHDMAPSLLNVLLTKVESAGTAEKIAENDHLMKCAMRVIVTARQTLTPGFEQSLGRLVGILGVISKNPSNPQFDQYIFESISGLMRFVVNGTPSTLPAFEQALFGPFTVIIQQDIDQYIPYIFQVLAQMLDLQPGAEGSGAPDQYRSLLPFLFTPEIWRQQGSIPGLVKLLKAFFKKDSQQIIRANQLASVFGVLQQRLIPSKLHDVWGFELLQSIVIYVPPHVLEDYLKAVVVNLLMRLQESKTEKFVYLFAYFLLYTTAIQVDGLTPDYIIGIVEKIQPQLWSQIMSNFVIPQVSKMVVKDRKVVAVGLTRLLTQSKFMASAPNVALWPRAFEELTKLFKEPQYLNNKSTNDATAGITEVDIEEQTAGYQAAYSRLAASESAPVDPVAYVRDAQSFLGQELLAAQANGLPVKQLITSCNLELVEPLVRLLVGAGYAIV